MMFWILIFTALAQDPPSEGQGIAPTPIDPQMREELARRFTSTVVETRVDSQLLQVPAVKKCVEENRITDADLQTLRRLNYSESTGTSGSTGTMNKREAAKECFEGTLSAKSDAEIIALADQLNLETHRLVPSRTRQAITDYFTKRIQRALYGEGSDGENRRKRDTTLVDHGVFVDLYENQLGRNILTEVSNYCYHHFIPKSSSPGQDFNQLKRILNPPAGQPTPCAVSNSPKDIAKNCLATEITDTGQPTAAQVGANAPTAYQYVASQLTGLGPTDLSAIFSTCMTLMNHFCNLKNYCEAMKQTPPPAVGSLKAYGDIDDAAVESKCGNVRTDEVGNNSCLLQAKIRAFRVNTEALTKVKDSFKEMEDVSSTSSIQGAEGKMARYQNQGDNSVKAITTLTTKDTQEMVESLEVDQASLDECSKNPETPTCDAYYYSDAERVKFEELGQVYDTATAAEKERIERLKSNKDQLKTYLEQKGYNDLVAKMAEGVSEAEIVAAAKVRFEAERTTAYAAMEERFISRQVTKDGVADPALKTRYQQEQAGFSQLMLFNNVVTSYMEVDNGGQKTDNQAVWRREFQSLRDNNSDAQSLTYFEGLSSGGNQSTTDDSSSVLVDIRVLDQMLRGDFTEPENGTR